MNVHTRRDSTMINMNPIIMLYRNDMDKPIKVVQSNVCLKIYPYITQEYKVAIRITMMTESDVPLK